MPLAYIQSCPVGSSLSKTVTGTLVSTSDLLETKLWRRIKLDSNRPLKADIPKSCNPAYIEHASSPSAHVPAVKYQGFESSAKPVAELRQSNLPPTLPLNLGNSPSVTAPIFELGRVDFPGGFPAPIASVAVSSDVLAVAFTSNVLYVLEMQKADRIIRIEVPKKPTSELTLNKIFLDPSGRHLLINFTQGESWYWYWGWKKPKQLKRFNSHKLVIDSVAWNRLASLSQRTPLSTAEILLGTRSGSIFEACLDAEDDFFKAQERFLRSVFTLQEKQPITGIAFEYFPPSDSRKCLVIVTTSSRIYQFVGLPERRSTDGGEVFASMFAKYKDAGPKMLELQGLKGNSDLYLYNEQPSRSDSLPDSLCWSTGQGIYHGQLNFKSSSSDFVDGAELLPYPEVKASSATPDGNNHATTRTPVAVGFTAFHFILLFADRLTAIGRLDQRVDHEELLLLKPKEQALGIVADSTRSTYWIYTNFSMFEVLHSNEDRDVWSAYLSIGKYDQALRFSKSPEQLDMVYASQARAYCSSGQYLLAAQSFSKSSRAFEEVTLGFVDNNARDALRLYLISRLEQAQKSDFMPRMILASWLVELYLHKFNELEDAITAGSLSQNVDNLKLELNALGVEFAKFLKKNVAILDKQTVYESIQSHGRAEVYINFATIVGDHYKVAEYCILEEAWIAAIDVLTREGDPVLYYKYSAVLMRNAPKELVDSWLKLSSLDPLRLVPAISQCTQEVASELQTRQAIRFLNFVIFEGKNQSSMLHNLLIALYVTSAPADDAPLLQYLANAPENRSTSKPCYDLDFALRLCLQYERMHPCVQIYSQMGLWEECVDLALSKGELDLAKRNADMAGEDDALRKKLWLKIAKYVVEEEKDIKSAMQFLEAADVLKIEDILPLFPDFVVIDDFKDEICNSLEGYSHHIETLKSDMDEATKSVEAIKRDVADLKNRFITLDSAQRCSVCSLPLFSRQFYVFPCQHTFHADCLISLVKEAQPPHVLRKMIALQTDLLKLNPVIGERTLADTTGGEPKSGNAARNLLSASFVPNGRTVVNAAGSFGRGFLSAGDRLRDLIAPESLASLIGGWGTGSTVRDHPLNRDGRLKAKLRQELDDLLTSSCALCDSIITGVEKPFVDNLEKDASWNLV